MTIQMKQARAAGRTWTLPTPVEKIAELAALGGATEIADHLHTLGVTGRRVAHATCPIAVVVELQTNVPITICCHDWGRRGMSESIPTPGPVQEFIRAFDGGAFPQLDSARVSHPSAS